MPVTEEIVIRIVVWSIVRTTVQTVLASMSALSASDTVTVCGSIMLDHLSATVFVGGVGLALMITPRAHSITRGQQMYWTISGRIVIIARDQLRQSRSPGGGRYVDDGTH